MCVLESHSCVLGTAKAIPWCPLGTIKASLGAPSFESPTSPLPPLKEQYEPLSLFMEETSICLRRHNGIVNNYKLKFQKSLSLHLHHLSQVRTRCPSGAHAVHVWRACGACLARPQCASGSPVASSLSPWSLNHQTSKLSLLSAEALMGARPTHEAFSSMVKSKG